MRDKLTGYMTTGELVTWGMAQFDIVEPKGELTDDEIKSLVRWIGLCAVDSILVEGEPILNRMGVGLMLTITLLEFPEYYQRFELSQFN